MTCHSAGLPQIGCRTFGRGGLQPLALAGRQDDGGQRPACGLGRGQGAPFGVRDRHGGSAAGRRQTGTLRVRTPPPPHDLAVIDLVGGRQSDRPRDGLGGVRGPGGSPRATAHAARRFSQPAIAGGRLLRVAVSLEGGPDHPGDRCLVTDDGRLDGPDDLSSSDVGARPSSASARRRRRLFPDPLDPARERQRRHRLTADEPMEGRVVQHGEERVHVVARERLQPEPLRLDGRFRSDGDISWSSRRYAPHLGRPTSTLARRPGNETPTAPTPGCEGRAPRTPADASA